VTVSAPDRVAMAALGTTAGLVVTDPAALATAEQVMVAELTAIDAACSRFRPDSELSQLHAARGTAVTVGPVLAEAVSVALRAAELTDGAVDPTVGAAVAALGYDRDFAALPAEGAAAADPVPAPGWWRVGWVPGRRSLLLPRDVTLDLGATAKALAADRIAARAAERTSCGVLVSLGGDVAAAGPAPEGGWRVGIGDDHVAALDDPDVTVAITGGGLATSGTGRRRWRRGGVTVHHIVDPRTGDVAAPCWRTVTVAAGSCVDANTASTAAIVVGSAAPRWLTGCALPARLVGDDGTVSLVAGWPTDGEA
jgi:thiamine biosynthesis lipoprotein